MAKDTTQPNQTMAPDNLRDILFARANYEEAKIGEIKAAFDAHDKESVFKLAEELIYGGPGTTKRP
jgi:hypothetical protein